MKAENLKLFMVSNDCVEQMMDLVGEEDIIPDQLNYADCQFLELLARLNKRINNIYRILNE